MGSRGLVRGICLSFTLTFFASYAMASPPDNNDEGGRSFLYLWASDADAAEGDKDFLVTVDVDANSATFADVISTTTVNEVGTMAHHLEPLISSDNKLYASGFLANKVYLFNMANPSDPILEQTISEIPGWKMPHSFVRQPNNNMIASLQFRVGDSAASGGLAIFDPDGNLLDTVSAEDPNYTGAPYRSYALDVAPGIDRVITTSTPMDMTQPSTDAVQIYRLSDMALLHTVDLPPPAADPSRTRFPFEIRVLKDSKSALLNTFECGFYLIEGIDTNTPTAKIVYATKEDNQRECAVPSLVGDYWVMPVQMSNEVVVLDISDLNDVHEVSVLRVEDGFSPHYSSPEPGTNRIALTGFLGNDLRVMMMRINMKTGELKWDEGFRDPSGKLGVDFNRTSWPHGNTGAAVPHGMVWSTE